jgi:nucleoid DNA-binding protein
MTKADLIQQLADQKMMSVQRAELVVDAVFACMEQSLRRKPLTGRGDAHG